MIIIITVNLTKSSLFLSSSFCISTLSFLSEHKDHKQFTMRKQNGNKFYLYYRDYDQCINGFSQIQHRNWAALQFEKSETFLKVFYFYYDNRQYWRLMEIHQSTWDSLWTLWPNSLHCEWEEHQSMNWERMSQLVI